MDRRAFLGAIAAGATASALKATAAERPLGETGVPLQGSEPLPLGPLPGGRYPDPHVESLKRPRAPSDKPGSRDSRAPWRLSASRLACAGPKARCISRPAGCSATSPTTVSCGTVRTEVT